ncbi:hypothetical protein LP420_03960 [Massilia sp. B-10]|nr:hypothetical protein LP420_03960 [Massilia sp. B-10]
MWLDGAYSQPLARTAPRSKRAAPNGIPSSVRPGAPHEDAPESHHRAGHCLGVIRRPRRAVVVREHGTGLGA